jgi:hypothetical protein
MQKEIFRMDRLDKIKMTLLKELDSRIQRTNNVRQRETMINVRSRLTSLSQPAIRADVYSLFEECVQLNVGTPVFATEVHQAFARLDDPVRPA